MELSAVFVMVRTRLPVGEKLVRCEYVAALPARRVVLQLSPAPLSSKMLQSHVSGKSP